MTPQARTRLTLALTLACIAGAAYFLIDGERRIMAEGRVVAITREGEAVVLAWRGPVETPMARKLEAAISATRGETARYILRLDSPGGAVIEGRAVIEALERLKATHALETHVASGDDCLSMCVPIFLAGDVRRAGRAARFMFHEPSAYDAITGERAREPAFERRRDADRFFRRHFDASPMDPAWRERLRSEWVGRDVWKSGADLVAEGSGVVTDLEG